ncbi:MAG: hypothetical protein WB783_14015 [Arenicellales bacterium]|jgi:ABC-type multidrug transport system fused ATPase/permease subunit
MGNPFANLTAFLHPVFTQAYIVLMILAVAIGTVADILHKRSGRFFALRRQKSRALAKKRLSSLATASMAVRTLLNEVATAGEFCNRNRRISHVLMFYGFLLYLITTVVMVFGYPTPDVQTPILLPLLWNIGALMVLGGGYWFFFLIRVNVVHEHHSPLHLMRADLFIVSLLSSVTFALLWEIVQAAGNLTATKIVFGIYIFLTTVLFVSVPWSKFAHMFYKPAAAFQKRVEEANGSSALPLPADVRHQES